MRYSLTLKHNSPILVSGGNLDGRVGLGRVGLNLTLFFRTKKYSCPTLYPGGLGQIAL